jgi:hypothetical protein
MAHCLDGYESEQLTMSYRLLTIIVIFALMKNLFFFIVLFALASILFYACKEEEINDQQFVQNYFVGRWPVKARIAINVKNGDTILNDTTLYAPIDTLGDKMDTVAFTSDGKYIKNGDTLSNYSIDGTGDNISYSNDLMGTWNIKFLRLKSIILTQEKTEKKGPDTFLYYKEEQLIK